MSLDIQNICIGTGIAVILLLALGYIIGSSLWAYCKREDEIYDERKPKRY